MSILKEIDVEVYLAITNERRRQQEKLNLIASENYTSTAVLEATASVMTNKYAEGYCGRRYYGGCEYIDEVERLAILRAKGLFGAEHVNVQAHSGSTANMAAYLSAIKPSETIMGMDLSCGGHLTHGSSVSFSGILFNAVTYGVNKESGLIDFDAIQKLADKYHPKLIICGASAYSRILDFKRFREIADSVNAYLLADIAHIAGLVAACVHPSPIPYCDFVTTTTHKTLRGPRGGMIMCKEAYGKAVDKWIFPGIQGGPLMHIIAAKAVCFKEATSSAFKADQLQTVKNAQTLAEGLMAFGFILISGGTDNHLILVDLRNKGISGAEAEKLLEKIGIIVNKNTIPYDPNPAWITSGIRLGTPALTTRGMKESQMYQIARIINDIFTERERSDIIPRLSAEVLQLCEDFPVNGYS